MIEPLLIPFSGHQRNKRVLRTGISSSIDTNMLHASLRNSAYGVASVSIEYEVVAATVHWIGTMVFSALSLTVTDQPLTLS